MALVDWERICTLVEVAWTALGLRQILNSPTNTAVSVGHQKKFILIEKAKQSY